MRRDTAVVQEGTAYVHQEEGAGCRGDADHGRRREHGGDALRERGYPGVRPKLHLNLHPCTWHVRPAQLRRGRAWEAAKVGQPQIEYAPFGVAGGLCVGLPPIRDGPPPQRLTDRRADSADPRPPPEAPRQRAHRAGQTALGYSLRRPAVESLLQTLSDPRAPSRGELRHRRAWQPLNGVKAYGHHPLTGRRPGSRRLRSPKAGEDPSPTRSLMLIGGWCQWS
jgi:hypothetical protein